MPEADSTTWLTVSDFSPGIRQVLNAGQIHGFSPQVLGSAQAVEPTDSSFATYDCIALKTGGIGPMPFKFTTLDTGPLAPSGPDSPNVYAGGYRISGLHIPQMPIMDRTGASVYSGKDMTSLFVVMNYVVSAANNRRYRLYRYDVYKNAAPRTEIANPAGAFPFYETGGVVSNGTKWGFTPICDYRSSGAGLPSTPGKPYVMVGACDPDLLGTKIYQYPRPTFNGRVGDYVAIKQPVHLVPHQGRLFVNGYDNAYQYDPTVDVLHNDDSYWTIANQDTLDNAGLSSSLSQATVGAYGCFGSASSSELVAIRATAFGGLTIASDLNDPIITDYAGIQGTNGCHIDGVWTPIGFAYASLNGSVNVYAGGGRTQNISEHLEDGFWHQTLKTDMIQSLADVSVVSKPPGLPQMGKLAYINGYIFVPGNWLYDTTSNSWWRFTAPSGRDSAGNPDYGFDAHYFVTSPFGKIYCASADWAGFTLASSPTQSFIASASFQTSVATTWKWTSQLIPIAQESEINEVREFILLGMCKLVGSGSTITVTITSYPNRQSVTLPAFTFTDQFVPENFRVSLPTTVRGTHISVLLQTGNTSDTEAPTVFRFDIGLAKSVVIKNRKL